MSRDNGSRFGGSLAHPLSPPIGVIATIINKSVRIDFGSGCRGLQLRVIDFLLKHRDRGVVFKPLPQQAGYGLVLRIGANVCEIEVSLKGVDLRLLGSGIALGGSHGLAMLIQAERAAGHSERQRSHSGNDERDFARGEPRSESGEKGHVGCAFMRLMRKYMPTAAAMMMTAARA